MTRLTHTTAITLVLCLTAFGGANAFNSKPVVYGLPNTTINSSAKPVVVPNTVYSQPNTTINSSVHPYVVPNTVYSQPNTTINSSIHPYVVPNTVYSQPNTTINSSVHPYVVPNSIYGTKPSPALLQSMAAQAAAGKAASQVTIASQAVIAQNARFVPKGVLTVPSQLSGAYALNAAAAADTASGSSTPDIAAAIQMQSLTDLNATNAQMQAQAINTQLQAQQIQSVTDRQNILVNTQTSIFQITQDVTTNQAKAAEKMFNKWDQTIGN